MRYKTPFPVGVKLPEISVPDSKLSDLKLEPGASSLDILKRFESHPPQLWRGDVICM